jgi:hypothetical protein
MVSVAGRTVELSKTGLTRLAEAVDPSRRSFQSLIESLRRLQQTAASNGAQVVVVLQPTKEEVHLPITAVMAVDPLAALRSELDKAGIEYVDLMPVFRDRASSGQWLYFAHDSHPNRVGYALIASAVHGRIVKRLPRYGPEDLVR